MDIPRSSPHVTWCPPLPLPFGSARILTLESSPFLFARGCASAAPDPHTAPLPFSTAQPADLRSGNTPARCHSCTAPSHPACAAPRPLFLLFGKANPLIQTSYATASPPPYATLPPRCSPPARMSAEYLRAFVRATDDAPLEVQRSISEIQGKDCEARELLSLIKDMLANLQNVPSDEKKDKLTEIRVSDAVAPASYLTPRGTPHPSTIACPSSAKRSIPLHPAVPEGL